MPRAVVAPVVFDQEITALAQALLGAQFTVRGVGGTILETEAYGRDDPASHSFRGPSRRNAAMFGPPGSLYVYLSYGCHLCVNLVGRPGEAVLIRALWPGVGIDQMARRRGLPAGSAALTSGPGRVGQALGITVDDNGKAVCLCDRPEDAEIALLPWPEPAKVISGPRIGITKAADRPWRFALYGAQGVSRPFPPSFQTKAAAGPEGGAAPGISGTIR